MNFRFLTPRGFALVFMILWTALLLASGPISGVIAYSCCLISICASYVVAYHLALRAIDLGLVP